MALIAVGALVIAYNNPSLPGPWGVLTQIVTSAAKMAGG